MKKKFLTIKTVSLIFGLHISGLAIADGKSDYDTKCSACHGFGVAGAPRLDDDADWAGRIPKGIDILYENAIKGFIGEFGVMPAKGGFTDLSDDRVKAVVDYMTETVQKISE